MELIFKNNPSESVIEFLYDVMYECRDITSHSVAKIVVEHVASVSGGRKPEVLDYISTDCKRELSRLVG